MADLLPALLPRSAQTFDVEPPGACPSCLSRVPQVSSEVVVRTRPGERRENAVEVLVSLAAITVTALPCGHVVHERQGSVDA